jgi:uncharacterized surface protein with fasciclin (FAS1) repeats
MRVMKACMALMLIGVAAVSLAACGTPVTEESEAVTQMQPTTGPVVEAPTIEPPTAEAVTTPTIMTVLLDDGRFTQFVELLGTTGVSETLSGPGPYTVFAPTDDAFDALDPTVLQGMTTDELTALLLGHVLDGELPSTDIALLSDTDLTTMAGTVLPVTVDGENILVGDAQIIAPDIQAANGLIDAVDTVLMIAPPVPGYTATP